MDKCFSCDATHGTFTCALTSEQICASCCPDAVSDCNDSVDCEHLAPRLDLKRGQWTWKHTGYEFRFAEGATKGKGFPFGYFTLYSGTLVVFQGNLDLHSDKGMTRILKDINPDDHSNVRTLIHTFTVKVAEKIKDRAFRSTKDDKPTDFKPILDNQVNEVEKGITGLVEGVSWEAVFLPGKVTIGDQVTVEYRWMVPYYDSISDTRGMFEMPQDPIDPLDFDRIEVHFRVKPQFQPGLMDKVTVDRFLKGETVSFSDCFHSLLASEKKWMVYKSEEDHWFNALVKLSTFFYDCFGSLGYVRLHGSKETGKSRYLTLLATLSYHGLLVTQGTVASMFRLIHANKPTLAIDEFEKPNDDVLGVINQGYKKGAMVSRCDENDGFSVKFFDVYSPKAMASINELNATTQSRCFTQIMLKSVDSEQVQREEYFNQEEDLQQDLYILRLLKMQEVNTLAEGIRQSPEKSERLKAEFDQLFKSVCDEDSEKGNGRKLSGRLWEMTRPLFTVSKMIEEEDIRKNLQRHLAQYVLNEIEFRETETVQDLETTMLSYLVNTHQSNKRIYFRDIKAAFADDYGIDDLHEKTIGSILKKLGFTEKKRGTKGLTRIFIPEGPLLEACRTYRIAIPEDMSDKIEDFPGSEESEQSEESDGKIDPKGGGEITGIAEISTIRAFMETVRATKEKETKAEQDERLEKAVGPKHDKIAKHQSDRGEILRTNDDSPWKVSQ